MESFRADLSYSLEVKYNSEGGVCILEKSLIGVRHSVVSHCHYNGIEHNTDGDGVLETSGLHQSVKTISAFLFGDFKLDYQLTTHHVSLLLYPVSLLFAQQDIPS